MTALLGNGVPLQTAACISTGIGAIVCEYEGLPTTTTTMEDGWNAILDRIYEAAIEVESKLDR